MKATISFNLNDVDDRKGFLIAAHASTMAGVLFQLRHNFLRNFSNRIDLGQDAYSAAQELVNELMEPINEIGDDLIC